MEKKIHLHFFMGSSDWYAFEFDGQDHFFGFVILNGDKEMAEMGYFSLSELKGLKKGFMEVDCELAKYWKPRKIKDIENLHFFANKYNN
jgi:hypothetical protein